MPGDTVSDGLSVARNGTHGESRKTSAEAGRKGESSLVNVCSCRAVKQLMALYPEARDA